MRKLFLWATLILTLATGTALADSIDGRLGFTGKAGAMIPMQDDFISGMSKSKAGLAAGGGLTFGFGRNFAAEGDVNGAGVEYDPSKFIGTLGIRLFLPKSWSW